MRIVIPTYRRVDRQFTLRNIPPVWRKRTCLVVDKRDAREFRDMDLGSVDLIIHPPRIRTIAQKRAWILSTFDDEKILMLDDDLRFSRREFYNDEPPYDFRILTCGGKDVAWAFRQVERALDSHVHVGIAPRQGSNSIDKVKRWWPNSRMMYALGYRVQDVRSTCKLGRIEHREDMELTLQLLVQGYPNKVLVEVVADQVYGSRGGASEERSTEASNADAELLASWYPDFVKVMERDYKQSIPRKEVQIAWKKAYEYGKKRFED